MESALDRPKTSACAFNNKVLLKREDQQPVFSFKLRGAYNKMAQLTRCAAQARRDLRVGGQPRAGRGAVSANKLGCRAVIVMPVTTPQVKVDAVKTLGGEVVLHGDSYSDAYTHALTLEKKNGMTFVHPFDDPDVIAGQGTIAMEILRAIAKPGHDPARCGVRRHWRRRADLGGGQLHQGGAAPR